MSNHSGSKLSDIPFADIKVGMEVTSRHQGARIYGRVKETHPAVPGIRKDDWVSITWDKTDFTEGPQHLMQDVRVF